MSKHYKKIVVRGPLKKVGTANKVISYYIICQYITKKQNVRGPFTEERLNVRGKASTGEKGP